MHDRNWYRGALAAHFLTIYLIYFTIGLKFIKNYTISTVIKWEVIPTKICNIQ